MAKNRIFNLPETKGFYQVRGIVNGTGKERYYTDKLTKSGKPFRAVNFGVEFDKSSSMYIALNGMERDNVYFNKYDSKTKKSETKAVAWGQRNTFNEEGFRLIGINLGLTKTTDENGQLVNDKKTMTEFDSCAYINQHLEDGQSVFVKGKLDFSSYIDNEGGIRRSLKYVPQQISLCKPVEFESEDLENVYVPVHDFTQTIVFKGIDKEVENEKETGRFIVSAYIVAYSDIVETEFVITDSKLANLFRKNLKPCTAIEVYGRYNVEHITEEVDDEEDVWGEKNAMVRVNAPTRSELVITGANPKTIDKESYTQSAIDEALQSVRTAKTADNKFEPKKNTDDDWGDGNALIDAEDIPW